MPARWPVGSGMVAEVRFIGSYRYYGPGKSRALPAMSRARHAVCEQVLRSRWRSSLVSFAGAVIIGVSVRPSTGPDLEARPLPTADRRLLTRRRPLRQPNRRTAPTPATAKVSQTTLSGASRARFEPTAG